MTLNKRLNRLFETAPRIPFDNRSKLVLFSDCHRGEGSWADNFAKNQGLFSYALNHYYENGFTYIELGDGEELWENKRLQNIVDSYRNIYRMFSRFYGKKRLYMLYGNHDMEKRNPEKTKCLDTVFDSRKKCLTALCPGISFYESLVLKEKDGDTEILLLHGHQADFINYNLWILSRFLVRYLWKPLEMVGMHDPTSAAKTIIDASPSNES